MKIPVLALCLVLATLGSAFASSDVDAVNAATENLRNAMLKADKAALEKAVMPDLIYVHSAGKVDNAKDFVGAIVGETKTDTYQAIAFNNQKVVTDGNLAIVTHIFDGKAVTKGRNNDQPYDIDIGVTQLWKKTGEGWKLQARKATLLSF
jgi:ketosteroid isomerase-like protein